MGVRAFYRLGFVRGKQRRSAPRFQRALSAATMAAAMAGGGLLLAAAGAVPAYAAGVSPAQVSGPSLVHGGHTTMKTFTAHLAAPAANGIGPHTVFPCVAKPGAVKRGAVKSADGCLPPAINCQLLVSTPVANYSLDQVSASAQVVCSSNVTEINVQSALLKSGLPVATGSDLKQGEYLAGTWLSVACQGGSYSGEATAGVTFPPDYVLVSGSNPMHATSAVLQVASFCAPPAPPVGACAVHAPSPGAHPAGRRPEFKTCP